MHDRCANRARRPRHRAGGGRIDGERRFALAFGLVGRCIGGGVDDDVWCVTRKKRRKIALAKIAHSRKIELRATNTYNFNFAAGLSASARAI